MNPVFNVQKKDQYDDIDELIQSGALSDRERLFLEYANEICEKRNVKLSVVYDDKSEDGRKVKGGIRDDFDKDIQILDEKYKAQIVVNMHDYLNTLNNDINSYVKSLISLHHELEHYKQYEACMQGRSVNDQTRFNDMMISYLVFNRNESYYKENYPVDIREIDANEKSITDTYNYLLEHSDIYLSEMDYPGDSKKADYVFGLIHNQLESTTDFSKLGLPYAETIGITDENIQQVNRYKHCHNMSDVLEVFSEARTMSASSERDIHNASKAFCERISKGENPDDIFLRGYNELSEKSSTDNILQNILTCLPSGIEQDKFIAAYTIHHDYAKIKENFDKQGRNFDLDRYIQDQNLYYEAYVKAHSDFLSRIDDVRKGIDMEEHRKYSRLSADDKSKYKTDLFMSCLKENAESINFKDWSQSAYQVSQKYRQDRQVQKQGESVQSQNNHAAQQVQQNTNIWMTLQKIKDSIMKPFVKKQPQSIEQFGKRSLQAGRNLSKSREIEHEIR